MIGSAVDACTKAIMLGEVVRLVIIQAAPTPCTKPPKFDTWLVIQSNRKVLCLSGPKAEIWRDTCSSRSLPDGCKIQSFLRAFP